jgi:hypothetical protein
MEDWKKVPNYTGYEASSFGRVRSFKHKSSKILSQSNLSGYKRVVLSENGLARDWLVHRLVALAFLPNPENKPEVNHIDGDKTNNRLENLEWNTTSENQKHSQSVLKNRNGRSKLTPEQITLAKEKVASGISRAEVGRELGVGKSCISRLILGRTY